MRGMLAPIPCLVAPLALAGCTGRVVAVACAEPAPVRLIDPVPARDRTTAGLAASARLRRGFIRAPSVAVEIESCRPPFILGEVAAPGQYPYLPNMTAESAVAVAGSFSPGARRDRVTLTRTGASGPARFVVPSGIPLSPGDTVLVGERGF
jgi:polysaccharide biosynthesis/export protein